MERKNTGVFVKLAIFALAVFAVISIVYLQLTINEERTKRDSLKAEVSALEEERDALQNQVDAPIDEEYIIDIAKEKLNLRLPEEIIFYNNLISKSPLFSCG
ncbi:MAG: septum formation initiator family protein, partial [Clostridiales bacterium]|nr:septum formation initiator family protein [Clostridiales bacterium]